jgi:hypothetical protein
MSASSYVQHTTHSMKEQDEHTALVHITRTQLISEFYLIAYTKTKVFKKCNILVTRK